MVGYLNVRFQSFFENFSKVFSGRFYDIFEMRGKVPDKIQEKIFLTCKHNVIPEERFVDLLKAVVARCFLGYMYGVHFMFRNFQKTCLKYTYSECSLNFRRLFATTSKDSFFMFQSYAVNDCHNELFQIKSRRVCVIGGRRQKEKKDNNYPDIFKHFEIQTVFNINK